MKSSADLLFERVIQLIEPLTRFDRSSLGRAVERETQASGQASRWFSPTLNVQHQSQAGRLPSGIRSFPTAGAAQQAASQTHAAAASALPERLRQWAARHGSGDSGPSASDCFDGQQDFGSEARCGSCSGAGKNRCGACGGRGRKQCHSCGGRGQSACRGCGGNGTDRCGSCGGMGRQQRYVTKTVWDGYNNRYNQHSETVTENCNMCMGSGQRTCGQCGGRRNVTCYGCAGGGQINCGSCGASGYVSCSTCSATGSVHQRWRLEGSVASRFEVQAAHDTAEVVAQLQACTLQQLAAIAAVRQLEPEVRGNAVRRRYAFTCRITEMYVESEDGGVRLAAYGDQAHVFDFHNVVGVLLEGDLRALEQAVQAAPRFALGPSPELVEAVRQSLESEANAQLGEGGEAAQRLKAAGGLSADYADRLTAALRGALRKIYFGEAVAGATGAAFAPALVVVALSLAGWSAYAMQPAVLAAVLLAGAGFVVNEALARRRLSALFGGDRVAALLRGLGVRKNVRIGAGVGCIVLLGIALELFA